MPVLGFLGMEMRYFFIIDNRDRSGVESIKVVVHGPDAGDEKFDLEKMKGFNPQTGVKTIDFKLADVGIKNSHFLTMTDTLIRPVKMKVIEDQLIVFCSNCYPFKIFVSDGYILSAPIFARDVISAEIPNIGENFPFFKLDQGLESGSFFYAKVNNAFFSAYSTQIKPVLTVFRENLDENECLAYLEPGYKQGVTGLASNFYVDKNVAGLSNMLGRPIIVAIGPKEVSQDRLEYAPEEPPRDYVAPTVNEILKRVANKVYGNSNFENWDKEKIDEDVFLPAEVVSPLFLPLGFRFYVVVPYEYVPLADSVATEGDQFVIASSFYTEVRKEQWGVSGRGSGYAKCKIFEIGFKVDNNYKDAANNDVRLIGGENFSFPADLTAGVQFNYSEDFLITDWANDFPVDGSFIQGKHFYFTQNGKICFSRLGEPSAFSHPAKVLLSTFNYRYRYGSSIYTFPLADDFIREKSSSGLFYDFLNLVSWGKDTLNLNVRDAISYQIKASDGNTEVQIRGFVLINVGNLNLSGVQVITATDSGIYYWSLGTGVNLSRYLTLFKVADFQISSRVGLVAVHNKVYFTSENERGVYFINYNERDRSFSFRIANEKLILEGIKRMARHEEDRLFVLNDNGELYLSNVEASGMLRGWSVWTLGDLRFEDIFLGLSGVNFVLEKAGNKHLYVYGEEDLDRDEGYGRVVTEALIDLPPITASRFYPFHGMDSPKDFSELFIFSEGLTDLEVGVQGGNFKSLTKYTPLNALRGFAKVNYREVAGYIPHGSTYLSFKQKVGDPGVLGGLSLVFHGDRING